MIDQPSSFQTNIIDTQNNQLSSRISFANTSMLSNLLYRQLSQSPEYIPGSCCYKINLKTTPNKKPDICFYHKFFQNSVIIHHTLQPDSLVKSKGSFCLEKFTSTQTLNTKFMICSPKTWVKWNHQIIKTVSSQRGQENNK